MIAQTPRLELYPDRIGENAKIVYDLCHAHGATVAAVAKVTCANPSVVHAMMRAGADMVADSRIQNLNFRDDGVFEDPLAAALFNNQPHQYELVI